MVDLKEEQKYERLRKLGQELHIPIPEHFLELEVRDGNGKLIQRHQQRSHSWVRNAYNLLLSEMASKNIDSGVGEYGAGFLSIKDTGGVVKRGDAGACIAAVLANFESNNCGYRVAAGGTGSGILVGSDDTAESFEDFEVLAPIDEGTDPGELNHVAMDVPTKSYDSPSKVFTITWIRYFNNNSGGNVLVKEVVICTAGYATSSIKYITSRDKLASTVTVPDTGQLKVTYTFQLTYPS